MEKGYTNTRVAEILKAADVSSSSFQNIFKNKDGALTELTMMVFQGQFGIAQSLMAGETSPARVYALETAVQLALTEQNENLRDIYVESYTYPVTCELISSHTSVVLQRCFGQYLPGLSQSDFYEMDIGTCGMMRAFMARKCDHYFTLDKKIQRFLEMSLTVYHVPPEEQKEILAYVASVDIRTAAGQVLDRLFAALAMENPLNREEGL